CLHSPLRIRHYRDSVSGCRLRRQSAPARRPERHRLRQQPAHASPARHATHHLAQTNAPGSASYCVSCSLHCAPVGVSVIASGPCCPSCRSGPLAVCCLRAASVHDTLVAPLPIILNLYGYTAPAASESRPKLALG